MKKSLSNKKLLLTGLLVTLLLILAIVAGEYRARQFFSMQKGIYKTHNILFYEHIPDFSGIPAGDPLSVGIRINHNGFRGPDLGPIRGADRIIAIGDASTFGQGVKWENTYLIKAASRVKPGKGRIIEPINAAVNGYNLSQIRNSMAMKCMNLGFKIMIYGLSADDFDDIDGTTLTIDENRALIPAPRSEKTMDIADGLALNPMDALTPSGSMGYFAKKSSFFRLIYFQNILPIIHSSDAKEKRYMTFSSLTRELLEGKQTDKTLVALAKANSTLMDMNALVRAMGARLIVLLIPPVDIVGKKDRQHLHRKMRAFLTAKGIEYVDLLEVFERDADDVEDYYIPTFWHLSKAGHHAAAKALEVKIGAGF